MEKLHKQLEHKDYQAEILGREIFILAEEMHLQSNVGSLFRLSDAFGVKKIFLLRKNELILEKKISKIARSCHKYLDYKSVANIEEVFAELPKSIDMIGLEWTDQSLSIFDFKLIEKQDPILLVLGSERNGMSSGLLELCDRVVHIPMWGNNSSMNVIQSCSVLLFELRRQEQLNGEN